jgi:hypothetical protein
MLNFKYRKDIQGLRGFSVLLVLLYHLNIPFFTGGFIGVDIFFVISGYVITGTLIKEYRKFGRIDLTDFYELNDHKAKSVLGSMGTAFMMTTNIPHRGLPNIGKDREIIVCSFVIS